MTKTNELTTVEETRELSTREQEFELVQRKAKVYASSTLVPKTYQNNVGNVLVAMNMADRLNADLLMVMQNLYVVHGTPGWSAKFLIACFNNCGRFTAIKYRFVGEPNTDDWGCVAYATEIATGEIIEGSLVSMEMAKAEGWSTKAGSKWKTMPEQMLRYRAATFFIRTTAPDIGMGLLTRDEIYDSQVVDGTVARETPSLEQAIESVETPPEATGELFETAGDIGQ